MHTEENPMTAKRPVTTQKWRALLLIAVAELLVMSLWFSVTASAPELAMAWNLTPTETAWLTIAVQLGFVVGALLSAVLTLPDLVRPRYLVAGSAMLGAGATATIAGVVTTPIPAIALRFVTGMALAGVYPPGMKMMSGWFRTNRGFAIGVLVGALTVGSALPHLIRGIGGVGQPAVVLYGSAGLAVLGGLLVLLVGDGPYQSPTAPFDPRAVRRLLADRASLLANGGYFGHMWELYAVWTWIPTYLLASFAVNGTAVSSELTSILAFCTIAIGGVGAMAAGVLADRLGRTAVTSASMAVSGFACISAGVVFGSSLFVIVPFLLVWGFAIVADSAQFSTCITELAEPSYVGTALTLQTAIGFLLTTVSIQSIPLVASFVGWRWAFASLAIGPTLGTLAMLRLRVLPDAEKLAGGNR
ncbi:Nitrate/nitrite transporter NarK [Haladaptatus litoreus]|uniref:Nitrate/nitrite transporter NarK n=1 Tax=Haladaptatus litoreus TaxID=553468 RepID=A0A1N6YZE5_9EURY|nr:MFS transporter [Haladaptatus litoreus]SIR20002.1 Nitrate/nitrite transporter NarK [Haladaptatus litoreus]